MTRRVKLMLSLGMTVLTAGMSGCGGVVELGEEQLLEVEARRGKTALSITLDQTDPHLGDLVTFTTTGGSKITVACYQNGALDLVFVAEQPTGTAFLLGGTSSQWLSRGGDATCYGWLYNRYVTDSNRVAIIFTAGGAL